MTKRLYHGAAYYPELWDETLIEEDIRLMKEAGINLARFGEFAWSKVEPVEGEIDTSFFKMIIEKLYENGIESVMCTPTPTPPIWMTHNHPERLYQDENHTKMSHGARQHICTNHPYFRERANIITEQLAKDLGHVNGLIGWQLDNEFKCHVAECMCETCKSLWHQWLEEKYESIDQLNDAWGTDIWSEKYHSFDQVPQPSPAPFWHNASLSTKYQEFSMDKIAEFAKDQAELIRKHSNAPITHNSSTFFSVNNEQLFEPLDFASFDTYATQDNVQGYLFHCDIWRNFKKDRPFWIMETSPSHAASLRSYAAPHQDHYLRSEAVVAYALGGEAFCYWLWRQQRTGCEIPHGSVISAWGKPTIGYKNVQEVEAARKQIEPIIVNTKASQADVAITYSDRAKAFMKTEPHEGLEYKPLLNEFYRIFLETGIHRDLIQENTSLEGYKVLITPFIYYLSDEYIERAEEFVKNGGTWIVGPMTGLRTKEHTVHTDAGLGKLDALAGVETLYTVPLDGTNTRATAFGKQATLGLWSHIFKPVQAKAVGVIDEGLAVGDAFITEHTHGEGKIVMLGSLPEGKDGEELLQTVFRHYANESDVQVATDVTVGTIVAPRENNQDKYWIIVNMDGLGGKVTIPNGAVDYLTDEVIATGVLEIAPYEYRVLKLK